MLTILIAALSLLVPSEPAPAPVALVGARVLVDADAEPDVVTVLVRDGRIEALGADLDVPWDARTIDVDGLWVTPALLDAASEAVELDFPRHAAVQGEPFDEGRDVFAAMLTSNRRGLSPERAAVDVLAQDAADREAEREHGFGAALLVPGDGLLAGRGCWLAFSSRAPREAVLVTEGAHFGSLAWRSRRSQDYQGTDYPATLMGVMAHLRQVLLDARHLEAWEAHAARAADGPRPPADPVLLALRPVLAGEVPLVMRADEEEDIRLALGLVDEFEGLEIVILGGREAYELADELATRDVAVVLDFDFGEEPEDPDAPDDESREGGRRGRRGGRDRSDDADTATERATEEDADTAEADDPADLVDTAEDEDDDARGPFDVDEPLRLRRDARRRWVERVAGPAVLADAGVRLAAATLGRKPGELLGDVRKAIEIGDLAPRSALGMLTQGPHTVFGDRTPPGRIEVGAPALLTAWSRDFADEDAEVRVAIVDGHVFDLRDGDDQEEDEGEDEGDDDESEGDAEDAEHGDDAVAAGDDADDAGDDADDADDADTTAVVEWPVELDEDRVPSFSTGGSVFVDGATILTASPELGTLEDADLLVRDGVIEAIGQGLTPPDGVVVVDGQGRWVIPGIIDCHSHAGIRGGINEWTRSITAEVTILDEVDPDDVTLYRALGGGATTARLLHGSANAIGGRHAVIKHRWGRTAPEMLFEGAPDGVKFALGENPRRVNWGDNAGSRYPSSRMGVETVYRRAFAEAREYRAAWDAYESAVDAGRDPLPPRRDLRLEALAGILDGSVGVHSHCYRADEIVMLMRIAEDFGFRVQTFQHVLEGYKVAAELAAHGAGASTFADWWAFKIEAYDAIPYNAELMDEAGVNVSINSDSGEHLRRLYLEAAKCVKYGGMSEADALATITLNPAVQLGIDAWVGSLEEGKHGDFAVFDRHPFDVRTRCLMTFIEGELYFERREGVYDAWVDEVARRVEAAAAEGEAEPDVGDAGGERDAPLTFAGLAPAGDATRAPSSPERPAPAAVALVGGVVHTMEPDVGVLDPGVVLMRDGWLAGVYEGETAPDGYTVVDVSGQHVWPGMINAGTALGLSEIGQVAASVDVREIGGVQPDVRAATAFHLDSEHLPVARVNGITTALVAPGGGSVSGQSALMALEGWTASDALVADPVALHVNPPRTSRDADEKDPLEERVREAWEDLDELFDDVREYVRVANAAAERGERHPRHDPRLEALAPYVLGLRPIVFQADSPEHIADVLDFAEEQRVRAIIGGGREAWKVAERLAIRDVPVIVSPVLTMPRGRFEPYDATYANAGLLHRAGVRFAFATGGAASARDLPYHAGMAVAFGLDEDAALSALTADAARILGVDGTVGSLKAGKRADVVVTDASLLQITTALSHVFIGGREVPLTSKHTDLYERFRGRLLDPGRVDR